MLGFQYLTIFNIGFYQILMLVKDCWKIPCCVSKWCMISGLSTTTTWLYAFKNKVKLHLLITLTIGLLQMTFNSQFGIHGLVRNKFVILIQPMRKVQRKNLVSWKILCFLDWKKNELIHVKYIAFINRHTFKLLPCCYICNETMNFNVYNAYWLMW